MRVYYIIIYSRHIIVVIVELNYYCLTIRYLAFTGGGVVGVVGADTLSNYDNI